MANDPRLPEVGEVLIDARELIPFLKDLPEGAMRGMRAAQDGFEGAWQEVSANQIEWGDKAGITVSDFAEMQLANNQLAQISVFLPAAHKLVELLEESYARLDDQRQRGVHGFARSVEDRAKVRPDGPTLLAKYEKTRAYKSAIGMKAYKTRLKNVRDAEADEAPKPGEVLREAPKLDEAPTPGGAPKPGDPLLGGGLAPEQLLLALPDEVLRALSDTYLDMLPAPTRAAIRARIGR